MAAWSGRTQPTMRVSPRFFLILLVLPAAAASHVVLALRGGALSREEIVDKLNRAPTFAIVDDEDRIVPLGSVCQRD